MENELNESLGSFVNATNEARINVKKARKVFLEYLRADRIQLIKESVIGSIIEKDPERLCGGCELEGTFCEGRLCELMAEVFFEERDESREFWRRLYINFWGKKYYNLSHRNKMKLINP